MYARNESARTRPNAGGSRVLVLVAAVVVIACVSTSCTNLAASPTTAPASFPSTTTAAPPMTPGACHLGSVAGQPMPDEWCTPGSTNAAVTQGTIHETICKSGWTATVRPPVGVTDAIKAQSAHAYGIPAGTTGELDHKIALEVGGDPGNAGDVANLWFEPGPIPNPKDTVERVLNLTRDLIAVMKEIDPQSFALDVSVELPEEVTVHLKRSQALRQESDRTMHLAAQEVRVAAKELRERGLTVRDIGAALDVSYQRAHQLISS